MGSCVQVSRCYLCTRSSCTFFSPLCSDTRPQAANGGSIHFHPCQSPARRKEAASCHGRTPRPRGERQDAAATTTSCQTAWWNFIIIREVLISTLSIFIPLQQCISWYPLATGVILNDLIYRDHIIQYTPCSQECTYQYCP